MFNNRVKYTSEKSNKIFFDDRLIFDWSSKNPLTFIGYGEEAIDMLHGNYDIKDNLIERIPLRETNVIENENDITIECAYDQSSGKEITVHISLEDEKLKVSFEKHNEEFNRFWLRVSAENEEKIYGCGEQYSHFNLRGKNFPLWTSEPGVGRNKKTYTTFQADVYSNSGGDYYNTYFPQQTFISTKKYYLHVNSYAYADFDFRDENFHELHFWEVPESLYIETGSSYLELVEKLTGLLGRQQELPDWVYNGIVLGLQGGTERVETLTQKLVDKGVNVAGIFAQDWQGSIQVDFGKRNFWNWKWDPKTYPELDTKIPEWKNNDIRFMAYNNPYLNKEGDLFAEANESGYLALNAEGETYIVDFGQFFCGIVDFTNPKAFEWFKDMIKTYLIDLGVGGWMADFGEYLPTDVVLHDGSDPMKMHNKWPMLWAKCNFEAVQESGKLGEVVYFMRAGATGSQKYNTLMWVGDQSVNWEKDDGIPTVIPASLSLGLSGMGLVHSDIGGYTSLYGNIRTKELFMRWVELATFSPFMRSHEGNRPTENFQVYDDDEAIDHLAVFTKLFTKLSPYTKTLVKENADTGVPVIRPIFMHYEEDELAYDIQDEYLFGKDMLIAPVIEEGIDKWEVYLPKDNWVHLWSGEEYTGGKHEVDAPIGEPPVFYRKNSEYNEVFKNLV